MGSRGPIYTLVAAAQLMGENAELVEEITANSDNVDYGELVHIHGGSENGLTGLTERGVECVEDLLADIRTWPGGIHKYLIDQHCDEEIIGRILADEEKRRPPVTAAETPIPR
jgi:hypothetical protein